MPPDSHHDLDWEGERDHERSFSDRALAWSLPEQEQPFSSPRSILSTRAAGSAPPISSPPVSPQSVDAPSFHTAISSQSSGESQDRNAREKNLGISDTIAGTGKYHKRKASITPALSVDTQDANRQSHNTRSENPRSPLSPESAGVVRSLSSSSLPTKSPTSPQSRNRGFSLRRSILARNLPGPAESGGSVLELQSLSAAEINSHSKGNDGENKKTAASVTVSPLGEANSQIGDDRKSIKKEYQPNSLPHYETLLKVSQNGLLARFRATKESIRKKILRIHDKPPSKDGRKLALDPRRTKALIDDRTGHEHTSNTILSTRYSLINFLPRQLFAQFSKLANFYFLCVSILQMIPGLSTTGTYTTIVPLLFFVIISIAKEGYDDLRRYRLDKAENNRLASVLQARPHEGPHGTTYHEKWEDWDETKWFNIRVGDIIRLSRDEAVPADIVVLQAIGTDGVAYVETMALDGETNLKSKQAPPLLAKTSMSLNEILNSGAHCTVEDPNLNLYNFEGKIAIGSEVLPLTNNEVIYRGSFIRNTIEVVGMVLYTGEECKIRMNATKNPRIKAVSISVSSTHYK